MGNIATTSPYHTYFQNMLAIALSLPYNLSMPVTYERHDYKTAIQTIGPISRWKHVHQILFGTPDQSPKNHHFTQITNHAIWEAVGEWSGG